jgi:hypothetical protein
LNVQSSATIAGRLHVTGALTTNNDVFIGGPDMYIWHPPRAGDVTRSGTLGIALSHYAGNTLGINYNGEGFSGGVEVNGTLDSNSVTTGALRVSQGGLSVAKNLFVGGSIETPSGFFAQNVRTASRASVPPSLVEFHFGTWTNNNSGSFSDCIHFNSWADTSGGAANILMLNKNAIGLRIYQSTAAAMTDTGAYTLYRDAVLADSTGGATISGGLRVTGSVTATSYFATSDSRIKKNIMDISNSSLDILRKIQPRKYEHIDYEKQGSESIYGFIAQEVKQVLPAAVSTNPEFVPSIYENAFIDNKTITLINKSTNDILNGNIKLYDKNRNEIIVKKINAITDKMFSIDAHVPDTQVSFVDEDGGPLEQRTYNGNTIFMKSDEEYRGIIRKSVFVYGHHVDDFHVLNKDTIWTILLSSTQELDKQVQANNTRLEAVNKQQEDRISELEATVKRQQAEIDEIKEMLKDCVYR